MKVTSIYSDSQGETHFKNFDVPLENFRGGIFKRSKSLKATSLSFSAFEGTLAENWHNAPRKQCIIILSGKVDLGVSDGVTRRFGAGNVLLLEDTTGKGHTTHSVEGKLREEVWVGLE